MVKYGVPRPDSGKDKDKDKERKGVQGETKTYGEFLNVRLTDEEYEKLQTKYGNRLTEAIEKLSGYIASKGNKVNPRNMTIVW